MRSTLIEQLRKRAWLADPHKQPEESSLFFFFFLPPPPFKSDIRLDFFSSVFKGLSF